MMAPGPVRVVHRGDVLAQPEISADTAPSPTPNRTSTGNQRERLPSTVSMTSVNASGHQQPERVLYAPNGDGASVAEWEMARK